MGVRVSANLSISRAWDETREIFNRDGSLLIAVSLALIVLPGVLVGIIGPQTPAAAESSSGGIQLLRLLAALITIVGQLALIRLAIGPSTTVKDAIVHGLKRFPSAFAAFLIVFAIIALIVIPLTMVIALLSGVDIAQLENAKLTGGQATLVLLLIILALLVSVRFTLVSAVASAEAIGPIAIVRRAWDLTKGQYWRMLGFVALLVVAFIVLFIAAGIVGGILARLVSQDITPFSAAALIVALVAGIAQGAFSILTSVMLARVYAQLAGRDVEASVPSSGI